MLRLAGRDFLCEATPSARHSHPIPPPFRSTGYHIGLS